MSFHSYVKYRATQVCRAFGLSGSWGSAYGFRVYEHDRPWSLGRPRELGERSSEEALARLVQPGDSVLIVGGGAGLTALASLKHGASRVEIWEPSSEIRSQLRMTIDANGLNDIVSVGSFYVGDIKNPWGKPEQAECRHLKISDADIIEMDCEGGEMGALNECLVGDIKARALVLECHGYLGSPPYIVKRELRRLGYRITREEVDNVMIGLHVLTAER